MKPYLAIAAISENRVMGRGGDLPWHLPEDFKWFKRKTTGNVLVMGRKTFESIGRPLPDRETVVLTRGSFSAHGVRTVSELSELPLPVDGREVFICGGAEVFRQLLSRCSDLFLTRVHRVLEGDAFFPEFEADFEAVDVIERRLEFTIVHYRSRESRRGDLPSESLGAAQASGPKG